MPIAGLMSWISYLLAGQFAIILVGAIVYWIGLIIGTVLFQEN
jgi:hypothetical protein